MERKRPELKNLSQGARLKYIRDLRYLSKNDVADYFELGGERKERTISRYENNSRVPNNERLKELAKLYNVSINAVKKYDFNNPIDVIYFHMWLEEEFPYYEISFDSDSYDKTDYNMIVQNAIREWQQMREKRQNLEISDEEYLEWKLNFEVVNPIK